MKHLRLFETTAEFDAEKSSLESPCVALTEDDTEIHIVSNEPLPFELVDLGLPSGLKWASCNLGATKPEGYGDYYLWGSVTPNTDDVCDWAHAPFNNGSDYFDEDYFNAHKSEWLDGDVLKPEYDAAYQATNGKAHMPTKDDFDELLANTTNVWTTENGVNGYKFTASNGNSIFIPASGNREDSSLRFQGDYGYVWSSSLLLGDSGGAWLFNLYPNNCGMSGYGICYGYSVRPISE